MLALLHQLVAFLATWFLVAAALGIVHQGKLIHHAKNSSAVSSWRFLGVFLSNVVWVLIALSTQAINFPLLIGCSCMLVASIYVILSILRYPPKQSAVFQIGCVLVVFSSLLLIATSSAQRQLLLPISSALGILGVLASLFLIHAGTLAQYKLNAARGSVKGLSFWNWSLHWLDWGIWVVYPLLLGLAEHWAAFVNAAIGLVLTTLLIVQYVRLQKRDASDEQVP
jgi:hypothetical protein